MPTHVTYRFQFGWKKYSLSIRAWREWSENATILHTADEPAGRREP